MNGLAVTRVAAEIRATGRLLVAFYGRHGFEILFEADIPEGPVHIGLLLSRHTSTTP